MENKAPKRSTITPRIDASLMSSCHVTWNSSGDPDANATPGTLKLKLVQVENSIYFVPSKCKVTDSSDQPVPLTVSATALSFSADAGETYTLTVFYAANPAQGPASAHFTEDCDHQRTFFTVDDSEQGLAEYEIAVA